MSSTSTSTGSKSYARHLCRTLAEFRSRCVRSKLTSAEHTISGQYRGLCTHRQSFRPPLSKPGRFSAARPGGPLPASRLRSTGRLLRTGDNQPRTEERAERRAEADSTLVDIFSVQVTGGRSKMSCGISSRLAGTRSPTARSSKARPMGLRRRRRPNQCRDGRRLLDLYRLRRLSM